VVGGGCNEGKLAALAGFKRSRAAIRPAYPIPIDASARASPIVHLNMAALTFKVSRLRVNVERILSTSLSANLLCVSQTATCHTCRFNCLIIHHPEFPPEATSVIFIVDKFGDHLAQNDELIVDLSHTLVQLLCDFNRKIVSGLGGFFEPSLDRPQNLAEVDEVGSKVLESWNSMLGRAEVLKHPYSDCVTLCSDSSAELRRAFLPRWSHNERGMSLGHSAGRKDGRGFKIT
jgi:hypothetical protein